MRLNPLYPSDNPMEKLLYCFGGGDTGGEGSGQDGYSDLGDAGDTGVSASVAAGGRGWGPSRGEGDNDQSSNDSQDRRVDSRGNTTNFNIDRSQPSVTADVNGVTRTVYGTQSNLDKAVAGGDINPVANVQNNYTPGTDAAVSAFNAAVGQQAPAAAGPALADTDIFSPTNITGDVFQTPYQQSIMTPQQRMESAYIDSAVRNFRTDQPIGLADRSVIGMMTPMEAAENSYLNDISIGVDTSPLFDENNPPSAIDPSRPMVSIRGATPADMITAEARAAANQLLGADRTRPTAAEVAAANARFAPSGMQPTTTEVDAYNQAINEQIAGQLGVDSYSPGSFNAMKEVQDRALAGQFNVAGLPGAEIPGATRAIDFSDIEAADARDQGIMAAVNAAREVELETGVPAQEVAGIIGLTGPAVSTSRTPQEMALTGSQTFDVQPADQRLTGASGAVTDILSGYDQALAPFTSAPGPIGMDQVRADEIDLERQQYEDYINTGQVGRELAPNEVVSFADFEGKELSSFKPAQTAEERANQIANFALNKDPRIASAAQQALANTTGTADQGPMDNVFQEQPEDYSIYGQQDYLMGNLYVSPEQRAIADAVGQRGPSGREAFANLVRADAELGYSIGRGPNVQSLRDAQRKDSVATSVMDLPQAPVQAPTQAATLTEAERMSQQAADAGQPMASAQGPSPTDFDRAVAEEEGRMSAQQQFTAGQAAPAEASPYTSEGQAAVAQALKDMGFDESNILGAIAPEGTLPGDEQRGAFFADLETAATERPLVQNPLAGTPLSMVGEVGTGIYNTLMRGDAIVESIIDAGGRPITDENGFIVGAFDPKSNRVMPRPGEAFNPALEDYYAMQREAEAAERERSGGDGGQQMTPMPALGEEDPIAGPAEPYQGRDVIKPYQYTPRGPLTYAYTGLPSLAPTRLRPSYTARKTFSPLFPVS